MFQNTGKHTSVQACNAPFEKGKEERKTCNLKPWVSKQMKTFLLAQDFLPSGASSYTFYQMQTHCCANEMSLTATLTQTAHN